MLEKAVETLPLLDKMPSSLFFFLNTSCSSEDPVLHFGVRVKKLEFLKPINEAPPLTRLRGYPAQSGVFFKLRRYWWQARHAKDGSKFKLSPKCSKHRSNVFIVLSSSLLTSKAISTSNSIISKHRYV